jgi:hypothetical protein
MRKLSFFIVLAWICAAQSVSAYDFAVGGIAYNIVSGTTTVKVTANAYTGESYTIPATVINAGQNYTVVEIEGGAFKSCANLKTVVIPNSVTNIGNSAFESCGKLENLTIGDGVTAINQYAFNNCPCLKTIVIPNSVTTIGISAFQSCTALTSVTFGNRVSSLSLQAFNNCSSLLQITLPASLVSLGDGVFSGCSKLTAINVDAANPYFASENGVLYDRSKATLIQCPGGKTGSYVIPEGVKTIASKAFYYIPLTSLSIPSSTTTLGREALIGCSLLTSLYCRAATPPTVNNNALDGINYSNCKLYVPANSVSAYKNHERWQVFYNTEALGINEILADDPVVSASYYTLTGKAVLQPQPGNLYVVKELRRSGKITISKSIN